VRVDYVGQAPRVARVAAVGVFTGDGHFLSLLTSIPREAIRGDQAILVAQAGTHVIVAAGAQDQHHQ
jgi:hypothetical protein